MNSTISIYGMITYRPDLFDEASFPDAVDREILINQIIIKTADMELLYPDADFMKQAIRHWSEMQKEVFIKMVNTTTLEYNPIWNKDGTITETVQTSAESGNTASVKGFNSNTWAEHTKGQGTAAGSEERTRRETGNIGVTTTQQMIREEREVSGFNIYDYIADDFKQRFCIMVY